MFGKKGKVVSREKEDKNSPGYEPLSYPPEEEYGKRMPIPEAPKPVRKEEPKEKAGEIMQYAKDIGFFVIDENGEKIPCENFESAKIISLLIEIKQLAGG